MVSLGCLIGLAATVAPRVVLVLAWVFADRWVWVWNGDILMPLVGIVFLPYTTIMYLLAWQPVGLVGFAWAWLLFGFLLDLMNWGQALIYRRAGFEYFQQCATSDSLREEPHEPCVHRPDHPSAAP